MILSLSLATWTVGALTVFGVIFRPMRFDVCPITKTILGLEISPDRLSTARPATVAAPERARKRKPARPNADAWPLPGMPRTVVIDCPEFRASRFRDVVMTLREAGPDPEG